MFRAMSKLYTCQNDNKSAKQGKEDHQQNGEGKLNAHKKRGANMSEEYVCISYPTIKLEKIPISYGQDQQVHPYHNLL